MPTDTEERDVEIENDANENTKNGGVLQLNERYKTQH